MADNGTNMLDDSQQDLQDIKNMTDAVRDLGQMGKNINNGIQKINDHFKGTGNNSGNGPNQAANGANGANANGAAGAGGKAAGGSGGSGAAAGGKAAGGSAGASGGSAAGAGGGSAGAAGGSAAGAGGGSAGAAGGAAASGGGAAAGSAGGAAAAGGTAAGAGGGAAAGAGAGSVGGPAGMAIGAVAGIAIGEGIKTVNDPSNAMKFILLAMLPFLSILIPFWILAKILNPFSSTNTVDGDNVEALQVDVGKDENFLNSQGITADEITDEIAIKYNFDNQYDKMAQIIAEAVAAGYQDSLAQYPAGKQAAKNSITADHDSESSVYLYDGTYWGNVEHLNEKNVEAVGKDEKELEGNAWDDGNYLTDNSNNGAFDSGTAYIIGAYSVSKGNTSPVAKDDDYTYYAALEKLMNQSDTRLGYYKYSGATISTQLTQKVEVKKVEKVIKYEKKTDTSGSAKYCSLCTAQKDYTSEGENNNHAIGTAKTVYGYYCPDCNTVTRNVTYEFIVCNHCGVVYREDGGSTYWYGGYEYCSDCGYSAERYRVRHCSTVGLNQVEDLDYYQCNAGHIFGSENTRYVKNSYGASGVRRTYASEYFVYEVTDTTNEDFSYTSYKYTGNIAAFSYQDLLERMFLDDNPFYEDVQGTMYTGTYGGTAATITAGTEITLPSGLGKYFTFMGWQCITNTSSTQYKLMQESGMPFDSEGFGKINGRYVIACTSTFGQVGDYVDFYQSNGNVLKCIIGDMKAQEVCAWDPNPANQWGHQNGQIVVEFVVDKTTWYTSPLHANPGTSSCHPEWGGQTIVKAVNGGSWFTNPDFVQSLGGDEPGATQTSTDSSDMQLKVANYAVMSLQKNMSTHPPTAGLCAAWVSGIYQAAGACSPSGNAIDYWTKWKDSGSSDPTRIPVGAAVVASGSSSPAGMTYGHVGIYVGDTDGDGEGEVVDNIGRVNISSLSQWLSWQTTPVHPTYGGTYGPGFIGWVWPNGEALGSGYDYTGVDPSTLVYSQGNAASLSRAQRLANIMASPYYQWGVYYEYECDDPKSTEFTCPRCGADMEVKTKGILWWKTELPVFEYVKAKEPDVKTAYKMSDSGAIIQEQKAYTVSEKIDWYVNNMLNSIDAAAKYEAGFSGNSSGFIGIGGGNLSIVQFALSKVGTGGQESWAYFGGWEDQWCSMFVSFCAGSCGFEDLVKKTASCDEGMNWFKSKGLWQSRSSGYEPKPGDFIYFTWKTPPNPNDAQHVGIVEKVEGGIVYTVEGNTGGGGIYNTKVNKKSYSLTSTCIIGYGTPEYPSASNLIGGSTAEQIYNYLRSQGLTDAGAAGLMGNLNAESALRSNNMENSYESRLGYNDATYTAAVDNGTYRNFVNDAVGYGLAQWTYYTRKQKLYDYSRQMNTSISDLGMQLEFLMYELSNSFPSILGVLRTSSDLTACTRIVLYDFENPANPNLTARVNLARQYYQGT